MLEEQGDEDEGVQAVTLQRDPLAQLLLCYREVGEGVHQVRCSELCAPLVLRHVLAPVGALEGGLLPFHDREHGLDVRGPWQDDSFRACGFEVRA